MNSKMCPAFYEFPINTIKADPKSKIEIGDFVWNDSDYEWEKVTVFDNFHMIGDDVNGYFGVRRKGN